MMRRHARVASLLIVLFAVCPAPGAWGDAPTEHLREGVDRVAKILQDPRLKGDKQVAHRRLAISRVASEMFDFDEMAKRSLGPHWAQRTPPERVEFVRLFTDLVERTYIPKVDQRDAAVNTIFRARRSTASKPW